MAPAEELPCASYLEHETLRENGVTAHTAVRPPSPSPPPRPRNCLPGSACDVRAPLLPRPTEHNPSPAVRGLQ